MGKELNLIELIEQEEKSKKEYKEVLNSGMFFEWYPELTGDYDRDDSKWMKIYSEIIKTREQCGR